MKQSFCCHPKRAGRRLSYVSVIAIATVSAFVNSCAAINAAIDVLNAVNKAVGIAFL
jgi:hypothetical protein